MRCPSCQCEIPDAHRFCGSCGSPVPAPSQLPTATVPSRLAAQVPAVETPAARNAGAGVTALLVLAALTVFGFTSALAGRSALGNAVRQE